MEEQVLQFIRQVYALMGWPGVIALMALESACIPVPSELIMPLSGWMLVKEMGLPQAYVLLAGFYGAVGNVLGSALAYWVGLRGGRPVLEKYGRYILVSRRDLERADRWFVRYGDAAAFFSRLLPVVRTFISLPAGVARMSFRRFLVLTFLGSFPWSLGLAYSGYILGVHWEKIRAIMRPFDIPVLIALLALAGFYVYQHWRHGWMESRK